MSILRSGLLAVLVFALTVPSSRAFELDAGMLTTREALYQKWFKGELTLEQFKKAAQDAEKGGKRIHYIKELLDDEELMFKGQRVLKRSGTPAVEGRGVMSDEDLMLRDADELGLSSADRKQYEEMMETYYDRTVKKLRQKAGKVNSDALSTRTADDVLLWKPKPFKSKTMGHIEAEILTKAQEHEYAIYAAAGAGDKAKTIGQAEEAILDNLNKGGKGFAKDPSQWIGDDKMMHKLWDELRITAKDTHRSMKAVDFDTLLPGRYDRYVKLSGMKSMPNKLGIYELGSTLDEQFAGLRIEQEKMRKIMRTALKRSRTETATQIDDLLKRMKTIDSVSEMDVLMRQAGEVSDRMYRIGENFKHLENKFPSLIKTMEFPDDYLIGLNKMSGRLRRLTSEPTVLLMNLLVKYLPEGSDDLRQSLKVILTDELNELPEAAKTLQKELAGVAGLEMIALEKLDSKAFLKKLSKDYPNLTFSPDDELVQRFLKKAKTATPDDLARIVGQKAGADLNEVRELVTAKVRANVASRFTNRKFLLWEVDQKTQRVLLGDSGIKMVAFDGIIGSAMALYQTSTIMEQNLPPEEENLQIMNAWVTSLPMVGDFAQGIIDGGDAYYEGDSGKAIKSGIFLTLGVAYVVPGLQIPAIIGSLAMVGYEVGSSAWVISEDKNLVFTWVQSGEWDPKTGTLLKLYDARKEKRPVQPVLQAYQKLVDEGDIGYHSSLLDSPRVNQNAPPVIVTIRDSILDYAERSFLAQDANVKSSKAAIRSLYPDFALDAALREPLNTGRTLFAAHIIERNGLPKRDPLLALFVKLKKEYYTPAVNYALSSLKKEAEAEYQAEHGVGEVAAIFEDLAKLDQRLGLNLTDHVNEIHESFIGWSFQVLKSPWNKHSIPRRHVELARKYRDGYKEIEKVIEGIQAMIKEAGLKSPKNFNLTGYLEIDQPRIEDLETVSYPGAFSRALKDAEEIAKDMDVPGYEFSISDSCCKELYQKLAQLRINIVHSEDWKLLLDQWTGRKSAAEQTRDAKLHAAQNAVSGGEGVFYVPLQAWRGLSDAYEEAYVWANITWEGNQAYADARATVAARIKKLEAEYDLACAEGIDILLKGLGKLTVHVLCQVDPSETAEPIRKATVFLKDSVGKELELSEDEIGDYLREKLAPGDYTLFVSAKGYETAAGTEEAVLPITMAKKPVAGEAPVQMEKTVTLSQIKAGLRVQVIDAKSKAPVPSALVQLKPLTPPYEEFQEVTEEGGYRFEDLKPRDDYRIEAKADYYEASTVREGIVIDTVDLAKSTPTPIKLEITPLLSDVHVTVRNTVGDLLEKVAVGLGPESDMTPASGRVVFEDVSPSIEKPYDLTVELAGYAPVNRALDIKPDTQGQLFYEAVELQPGGKITVHVVEKGTGTTVPEPEIRVWGFKYDQQVLGDATGSRVFTNLALEAHYVEVSKEGYLPTGDAVEVEISATTLEHELTVELLEGMELHVINIEQGKTLTIGGYIAVDGKDRVMAPATVHLGKGSHTIACSGRGYSAKTFAYEVDASKGSHETITVELYPAMTITVEVRDHRGALMGDATVSLLMDGEAVGSATGKAPLFSDLGAGSYTATVEAPGFAPGTSASVQLEGGYDDRPDSQEISIALTPYKGNLEVSVAGLDEGDSADIALSGPISVGASGDKATFRGLTRGSYTIAATAEGYNPATTTIEIIPASEGDSLTAALSLTKTAETLAAEQAAAEKKKKDEAAKKNADTIASLIEDGKIDEAKALLDDLSDEEKGAVIDLLPPADQTKLTDPQVGEEDEDEALSEDELDQAIEDEINALEAKEKKDDDEDEDADEALSEDDIEALVADGLDDLLKTKDPAGGETPPVVGVSVPDEDDEAGEGDEPSGEGDEASEDDGESEGDETGGEDEAGDVVDQESEDSAETETEEEKTSTTGKGDSDSGVAEDKPDPGDKPGFVDMPEDDVTEGEEDKPSKKGTSDLSDITNLDDADEEDLKDSIAGDVRGMKEDEKKQTDEELNGLWTIKGLVNTAPFVHEWQAHVKRENERDENIGIYLFRVYPLPARLVLKIDPDDGVVRGSVRTPFAVAIGAAGIQGIVGAYIDGELKGHYNAFTETMSGTVVDQGFIKGRFFMAGQEIYRIADKSDKLRSTWSAEGDPRRDLSGVYKFAKRGSMIAPIPMKFYTSASIESKPGFGRRDSDLENYVKKDSDSILDKLLGTSCFAGWQGGERNRFEAVLEDGQLTVYGQTYNDGLRRFNDRVQIGTASQVSDYELGLGGIDNLSNAGFLVYETTSGELRYMLLGLESTSHFGSRKQAARTTVRMQGLITRDYEMGSMDLQTYSRAGAVSWINESGREDSGHISKIKGWCND